MEIMRSMIEDKKPHIICFGETKISCPFIDTEKELKEKRKRIGARSNRPQWSPMR